MKIKNAINLIAILCATMALSISTVNAQKEVQDVSAMAPVVPISVLTKGNQAVGHYLMVGVDHVDTVVSGPSVVEKISRYFGLAELSNLGYIHRGSFTELSDAMAGAPYSMSVIPTPQGYYDVRMDLTYYTADNREALKGSGWLNIWRQGGKLVVGSFQPYVWINQSVAVRFTNCINYAKWISKNGGSQDLVVRWEGPGTALVIVPGQAFQDGFLAVADCLGDVTAWNLETGETILGERIVALLGQTQSGDFHPVFNTIDTSGVNAYRYQGVIYGHVPLTEAVLDTSVKDTFDLGVMPWNSTDKIYPTEVYVTPVALDDGGKSGYKIDQEYPVPFAGGGKWFFNLPKGKYHIRMMFPQITDWSKGGGVGKAG